MKNEDILDKFYEINNKLPSISLNWIKSFKGITTLPKLMVDINIFKMRLLS